MGRNGSTGQTQRVAVIFKRPFIGLLIPPVEPEESGGRYAIGPRHDYTESLDSCRSAQVLVGSKLGRSWN